MSLVAYLILAAAGLFVGSVAGFMVGVRITSNLARPAIELAQAEQDRVVLLYEGEIARLHGRAPPRPSCLQALVLARAVEDRKRRRRT